MNCNELKLKIENKDAEVKLKAENAVKCFELVKDWVIDRMIEKQIENEFNCGVSLHPNDIHVEMLNRLGIDVSKLYPRITLNLSISNIAFDFPHRGYLGIESTDNKGTPFEQFSAAHEFDKKFDGKLFEKLIIDYILGFGFKQCYITNLWGKRVKTNSFEISRADLERKIFYNNQDEDEDDSITNSLKTVLFFPIAIVFVILCFYLAK